MEQPLPSLQVEGGFYLTHDARVADSSVVGLTAINSCVFYASRADEHMLRADHWDRSK